MSRGSILAAVWLLGGPLMASRAAADLTPAGSSAAPASAPAALLVAHVAEPRPAVAAAVSLELRQLPGDAEPRFHAFRPFAELAAYHAVLVASGWIYGNSPLKWDEPSWAKWRDRVTSAPVYPDGDSWWLNVGGHAIMGSDMYLMARNSGWSWWSSALFSNFGSFLWEYVTEGLFERPSLVDLISTPVTGSLLGEVRYRLFRLVRKRAGDRWYGYVALVLLDPATMVFEGAGWR